MEAAFGLRDDNGIGSRIFCRVAKAISEARRRYSGVR